MHHCRTSGARRVAIAGLATLAAAGLGACGSSGDSGGGGGGAPASATAAVASTAKPGDITAFCPAKPTRVAYIKSHGGDVWTAISGAEFEDEAAKCPNLDASVVNETGGQQAAISAIDGQVAQGTKVLVVQPDFGPSQLPAMRKAVQAGVKVVDSLADVGGRQGSDWDASVLLDVDGMMRNEAAWLAKNVKQGQVAFLGGPAGTPSSQEAFDAFEKAVAATAPGIKIVPDNIVSTDWTAGGKRRVVAGLMAKYGKYAAVASDYAATDVGVIQASAAAGGQMPALLDYAGSEALVCAVRKSKVPYFAQEGTTSMSRSALRIGLADLAGARSPEPDRYKLHVYADTAAGKVPPCDSSVPPDADLSSSLPPAKLRALFAH
jgi:ribose transport system substrate-binding protein